MNKKIKLVLCDIDGTLVNGKRELTQITKQAIKRLKKQGIYFGLASGRPYQGVIKKIKEGDIEEDVDVLITMNGAQLYDCINDKIYSYFLLEKQWIKEIIETYEVLDLNPCVYEGNTLLCKRFEYQCTRSAENNGLELVLADPHSYCEKEREKLLYTLPASRMEEVEAFSMMHSSQYYKGFKSAPDLFEFTDRRVSKSYGIEQFCSIHGFTIDECACFGDTTNDIEMLKDCGIGICMANGTDDAKEVSDIIALSNDEDGVALMIKELFLNDE